MSNSPTRERPTAYDVVFGADVFDEARFTDIRDELGAEIPRSAAELLSTPAAGELLRDLAPPEGGRDAIAQIGMLLFAAYRFWLHGRNVYRFDERFADVLDAAPSGRPIVPPQPAGYAQLPRQLFWARVSEDQAPEPVDGFFWTMTSEEDAPGSVDLLFALGVRAGRPGLSLFDVSVEPVSQLEQWAGVAARADGDDFANILPGGELKGYRAIVTAAEAVKLAALCFDHIDESAHEQGADG